MRAAAEPQKPKIAKPPEEAPPPPTEKAEKADKVEVSSVFVVSSGGQAKPERAPSTRVPRDFLRLAWGSIVAHRTRSMLTVLGIVIGILAAVNEEVWPTYWSSPSSPYRPSRRLPSSGRSGVEVLCSR